MLSEEPASDEGFTLIELVVTIAIMAIIVVTLVGVLFEFVRNANETTARLNESPDRQFISAYLQQDVTSIGLRGTPTSSGAVPAQASIWLGAGAAPSGIASACSSISNAVVGFAWADYQNASATDGTATWNAANNAAVYFTKTSTNKNGTTQYQLWRTSCIGGTTTTIQLARYLNGVPTISCSSTCTSTPLPSTVSMTITVQDLAQAVHASSSSTITLTAQRRQG